MVLVLGQLPISDDVLWECLAIVREVEYVQHVLLLLLHHLPTEVDNILEAEGFVILLPSVTDQDGIRLRQGVCLEICRDE